MSYILDALKKSDSERQQRQGPSLASVQQQQYFHHRARRGWGSLVLGGLAVALLCAAFWLYQLGYLQIALPAPAPNQTPSATDKAMPQLAVSEEVTAATQPTSPSSVAGTPVADDPVAEPAVQADAATMPPPANLRELWQLPSALRAGIPPLEFSLHVYSARQDQRSIIINNRMMHEGEYVNPELALRAITPDGVVMQYRNEYFRVSIVDRW